MPNSNEAQGIDTLPQFSIPSLVVAWEYWFRPEKFMARCQTMGDRFQLSLPGLPRTVCVSSAEDNRRIFAGDQTALHFGDGLSKLAPHEVFLGPTSIALKDDEAHLEDRRMLGPHFNAKAVKPYVPIFRKRTSMAMATWPLGRPISFHKAMMDLTLEIIIDAVFGVTNEERSKRLKSAVLYLVKKLGGAKFMVSTIIAVSKGGKWDGKYTEIHEGKARVDEILLEEMNERRQDDAIASDDLLNVFMSLQKSDPEKMTDTAIFEAMRTMLIAGYETTASTMGWLGERLVRHPEVIARLEQAVDTDDDAYIEAVVSEALRTRPVLPHTARFVVKPFDMGDGLTLPPGTMVLPMMGLCHHRSDIYPEPTKFNPQRFLDKQATAYELITFGGGIRKCLGAPFALLEMREMLRTIVREYHFEPTTAPNEKIGRRNITLVPAKGAQVTFTRRKNVKHNAA